MLKKFIIGYCYLLQWYYYAFLFKINQPKLCRKWITLNQPSLTDLQSFTNTSTRNLQAIIPQSIIEPTSMVNQLIHLYVYEQIYIILQWKCISNIDTYYHQIYQVIVDLHLRLRTIIELSLLIKMPWMFAIYQPLQSTNTKVI